MTQRSAPVQPTICLTMIVRNETHIVREALASVARFVSEYVVLDTGSSDGTQDVVRAFFQERGIHGRVFEEPFDDFGRTRTRALALARESSHCDYLWMLDADDRLVGEPDLATLGDDAYSLRFGPDHEYFRPQIFRRVLPFRYEGVVHEFATLEPAVSGQPATVSWGRVRGDYHVESRRLGARNADPEKYRNDAALLEAVLAREPSNARARFYAAQSRFDAGDLEQALAHYEARVALGGFREEVFYSRWRAAQCLERLGQPWDEVRERYLACFDEHPHRVEPLVHLAHHERLAGRVGLAYSIARRAAEVPRPDEGALFVDVDAYEYRALDEWALAAWYAGRRAESFEVNARILRSSRLSDRERARIEKNRDFGIPAMEAELLTEGPRRAQDLNARPRHNPAQVTLTITSCRRFDLFVRTVDSFLAACVDIDRIDRFICIDDGSNDADRERMASRYPFFEFVWKTAEDRGHARSMNELLDRVDSPYWLHLEDDFQFFERRSLVGEARKILEHEPRVAQVLFNRAYAEGPEGREILAGDVRLLPTGGRYRIYADGTIDPNTGRTNRWWPHFSLRPSLMRTGVIRSVGRFDEGPTHFELDFARAYVAQGHRSAFVDTICCRHIGRKTYEREDGLVPNAYQLNGQAQFGAERPDAIRASVMFLATLDVENCVEAVRSLRASLDEADASTVAEWICVDDGSDAARVAALRAALPFARIVVETSGRPSVGSRANRMLREVKSRYALYADGASRFPNHLQLRDAIDALRDGRHQQFVFDTRESHQPADLDAPPDDGPDRAFQLRPSLIDVTFLKEHVGAFANATGEDVRAVESEFAARAAEAGLRTLHESERRLSARGS